jgi:molecular chaperone HscB
MDPFATLGLERRFDVDLRAVERTHRDLSRATHPDRHSEGPPSSRAEALGRSVEINEAFRIVRDPIKRAEALFALAGIPVGETNEPKPSPALLMEILERREELEAAKDARDLAKVRALGEAIDARARAGERALAEGFDDADGDRGRLDALVHKLGELRFYRRFLEHVSDIEDALTELS